MLYLVGTGLRAEHLTLEAVDVLKRAHRIYMDVYTVPGAEELARAVEKIVGKSVIRASRNDLEDRAKELVRSAKNEDVAILAVGDPLAATTHVVLTLLADELGVGWKYVPGISIIQYIPSRLGLEHYKFGWTVTIPHGWKSAGSFFERIVENRERGLHTIALLDVGEKPMEIPEAAEALKFWAERAGYQLPEIVGIVRAAYPDETIVYASLEELKSVDWPAPPHSLVIPGKLHPVEEDALRRFRRGER